MATCDPQTLLNDGSCFLCLSEKELNVAVAQLLCDIASGGVPCFPENLSGVESPLNTVTPDWVGQVYVQDNGVVWQAGSLLGSSWTVICEPSSGGGDGLVFGPDPETATSINGQADVFLNAFGLGADYTTLLFGNPVTVTGSIDFSGSPLMTALEFGLLETVGGGLDLSNSASLKTFTSAQLISVGLDLNLSNTSLDSLNLQVLETVGGQLSITVTDLVSILLTSLVSVVGVDIELNGLLISVSLPALTSSSDFFMADNSLLTSFSAPNWVPANGTFLTFTNNALDATSVQFILRRCVLAGVTTCTIDLSGGTNAGTASLNAQGQADVATLGAQLTINP